MCAMKQETCENRRPTEYIRLVSTTFSHTYIAINFYTIPHKNFDIDIVCASKKGYFNL